MEDSKSTTRRNPRRGDPPPALPPPPAAGLQMTRSNPPRASRPAIAPAPSPSLTPPAPPAPPRATPPPPRCPATAAAVHILSPHNDRKSYRYLVLPNMIKCVLVSDVSSDKMVVALNSPAGYFTDPSDLPGSAELLQNTLLRGNPSFQIFEKLLSKNNGSINSTTLAERTTFFVDADSCIFEDVIIGFTKFFLDPSFCCTLSETDTSLSNEKTSDLDHLQKHLTNKNHPYHKFSPGNLRFALGSLKGKALETTSWLEKLYESYYSANLMTIVIYGSESLDQMEEIVTKNFSGLRNADSTPHTLLEDLCTVDTLQILVKLTSIDGSKALRVQWPLKRSLKNPEETDALKYILHVFNYNTEGSLFYMLKHVKKWISYGYAHETDPHSEFTFLSLDIKLTDEGMGHYQDVCGLVFRYIAHLKAFKPRKYIFEELEKASQEQLSPEEMVNPIEYVAKIASNIATLPACYCLVGSVPSVYSENGIRCVQNSLAPERVRIFLVSGQFKGQTNLVEPVNNIAYSVESVKGVIQDWIKNAPKDDMNLPNQRNAKKAIHRKGCASGLSKQALDTRKEEKLRGVVEQVYVTEQSQQVSMVKKEKQAANMEQISLRRSVRNLEALKDKQHGIFSEQVFTSQQSQQGYKRKEKNLTSQQIIETTNAKHAVFAEQQVNSSVCIIYDDKMLEHIPPKPKPGQEKHVEQPSRISAIYDRLLNDGLLERCSVYNSEPVDLKHVLEVHKSHYVVRLIKGTVEPRIKEERDDMFMSVGSVDAMLLSAGGAVKSCEMVATKKYLHSFAVIRPPGHHAKAEEERGFC